ncbi:MAG: hypothetical protein ACPG2Y_02710 [Acholeplasmataceae bacterium]
MINTVALFVSEDVESYDALDCFDLLVEIQQQLQTVMTELNVYSPDAEWSKKFEDNQYNAYAMYVSLHAILKRKFIGFASVEGPLSNKGKKKMQKIKLSLPCDPS